MAESITVSLILDDKEYTGKIQAAGKQAEDLGNRAKKAGEDGATGFGKLTAAAEMLRGKMSALTTVLLGAGFVEMSRRALTLGDDISDLSKGTDVSIARILQLRDAFAANGGNAEGLGKILNKLNVSLYDAQDGSAQAQQALLKLGFSFKDMANLNTDQALQKVIDRLGSIKDPVERNALAFRTLGKEAKNIDWAGIAAGTRTAEDEYIRYSASLLKAGEAHDKLQLAAEKLTIAFVGLLEGVGILDFINNMNNDMVKFEKIVVAAGIALSLYFGASAVVMIGQLATTMVGLVKVVEELGVAMGILSAVSAPITRVLTVLGFLAGAAVAAYMGVDSVMEAVERNNKARTDKAIEQQGKLEEARKKAADSGNKTSVTPYYAKELDQLDQISEVYARTNKDILDKVKLEAETLGLNADQLKIRQQMFDIDKNYAKQLADINDKIRQERNSNDPIASAAKIAQLEKEKTQVTDLYTTSRAEIESTMTATARQQRTFEFGWNKAWASYKDSATNAAENAGRLFNKITSTMEDTLIGFFKTGKLGWKDFANTIIEEMLRIQLRQTIAGIMPTAGPSGGGGNIFSGIGKLLGFAEGTPSIPTNGPVLVGERGPEILVGAQGMGVVPNNQIAGNTSVTYNINAVDAMSFKALVAQDPSFIHAVAMKGARTLPGGR